MRINEPINNEEYVLPDGEVIITRTDSGGRITYANQAFLASSGFALEECLGQPQNLVRHPHMPREAFEDMWRTIRAGKAWTGIVKNRRKNGGFYWVRANVTPMLEGGRSVGYMSVRVKPTAREIAAADALYRNLREGRARHIRLRDGEVIDTRLRGRLRSLLQLPLAGGSWLILGCIAALFGTLLCSELLRASDTSAFACGLAGAGMVLALVNALYVSIRVATPLRKASDIAVRIIGGEVTCSFDETPDRDTRQLLRLLNQMNAKLLGVIRDTRGGIDDMLAGVEEIARANEDLSRRTSGHAAGLEETASSMEELTSTVRQNADSAAEANRLATQASRVTQRGCDVVHQVVDTMRDIAAASRRIGDILGIIDSIAFQTNLLALNAAVEAARAGDQGRGFAVVAQEVRALAQRSAASAKEIKDLIEDSLARVEVGTRLAGEAGDTMNGVVASVKHVTDIMGEMLSSSREQSRGIEQVNQAVAEMDHMTQQDAELAQRVIEIAGLLRQQSGRVLEAISAFSMQAEPAPAVVRPRTHLQVVQHAPVRRTG